MTVDFASLPALRNLKARLESPAGERVALVTLLASALGNVLIYWAAFARPFSLNAWIDRPLTDLYRISLQMPQARAILALGFVLLGTLYWIGWRASRRVQTPTAWLAVIASFVGASAVLLYMYPFGAADLFDNVMHGRILGVYRANPFVHVGVQFPDDPVLPYVAWKRTPSAYGPLWEGLAGVTAYLAGDDLTRNVISFKVLSGLFLAASGAIVVALLRCHAPDRALPGAVLLLWNPVILYETIGNGHNDMAMVFWILAAAWLISGRRDLLAILALTAGALVKFIPLLMIPVAGWIALRRRPRLRDRIGFTMIAAVTSIGLVAAAYAPFWQGMATLGVARRTALLTTSIGAALYAWLAPRLGADVMKNYLAVGSALLTGAFALGQAWAIRRRDDWLAFPRAAFNILMFYLLITCLWFQSWYALWPLGLAALLPPGHAARLGALFGFAVLTKPLLFEPMWLWLRPLPPKAWRELRLGPAVMSISWAYALIALYLCRRKGRQADQEQI